MTLILASRKLLVLPGEKVGAGGALEYTRMCGMTIHFTLIPITIGVTING